MAEGDRQLRLIRAARSDRRYGFASTGECRRSGGGRHDQGRWQAGLCRPAARCVRRGARLRWDVAAGPCRLPRAPHRDWRRTGGGRPQPASRRGTDASGGPQCKDSPLLRGDDGARLRGQAPNDLHAQAGRGDGYHACSSTDSRREARGHSGRPPGILRNRGDRRGRVQGRGPTAGQGGGGLHQGHRDGRHHTDLLSYAPVLHRGGDKDAVRRGAQVRQARLRTLQLLAGNYQRPGRGCGYDLPRALQRARRLGALPARRGGPHRGAGRVRQPDAPRQAGPYMGAGREGAEPVPSARKTRQTTTSCAGSTMRILFVSTA